MSERTIVEINHDLAGLSAPGAPRVSRTQEADFLLLWRRAIASGSPDAWAPLERFGIRRIVQCHHSDERKVVAHGRDYPIR